MIASLLVLCLVILAGGVYHQNIPLVVAGGFCLISVNMWAGYAVVLTIFHRISVITKEIEEDEE